MSQWNANSPTSRLVGSGCLTCPPGHRIAPDDGLGALETMAKNIMVLDSPRFDGPTYPLSELPTLPAKSNLIGGDDFTNEYDYHIPDLQNIAMYDPAPKRQLRDRIEDARNNCGPEGVISNVFDMASLGCNPPRGKTGVMGKDVSPILNRVAPLELGPFCVTMFQNFDHLRQMFSKMQSYYPNAAMQVLSYQKIRDFVSTSYNLASATAGSTVPRFNPFSFIDRPNSVGSIKWFSNALDKITANANTREGWNISMSRKLFSRWMKDYAEQCGVTLNVDFASLNQQVGNYIVNSNGQDSVSLISERHNIKYTISFTKDPIFVTDNKIGENHYEWSFQPWFNTRPGDDTRPGEAAGWVRDKNGDYGFPCSNCPDGAQSLSEMILIYNGESHSYEAFPDSPFAGQPELTNSELSTDMQALWGSMNLRYYFGDSVDQYWLKPLYSDGEKQCPSNIDRTWFAARMWFAFRHRVLRKRASGALLVKVPNDDYANKTEKCCLTEEYPAPITLTNREPNGGNRKCEEIEDVVDPVGCLRPDCEVTWTKEADDYVAEIPIQRVDGLAGQLVVDFTHTDGTALNGVDYDLVDGQLTFEEGQEWSCIEVTVKGGPCVETNPACKEFTVNWAPVLPAALCDGVCATTTARIKEKKCPVDCDECAGEGCGACSSSSSSSSAAGSSSSAP